MIGFLLITHGTFGESLIQNVCHVLNKRPPLMAQFGGDAGRQKLSYKRVSQHISSLAGVSGDRAGHLTDELFTSWKGNEEQTDDVLMIGFSMSRTKKALAA